MEKVRVIVYGPGAIGSGAIRMMSEIDGIEIVGCIAVSKEKIGKDVGEVAGVGKKLGVIVSNDADVVLAQTKADVLLHTVIAPADEMEVQILKAINAGLNVITVSDHRIFYPWASWPEQGRTIDEAAKKNGVTVTYAGANPGFFMDLVPIMFTGSCESVKKIRIESLGDIGDVGVGIMKGYGFGGTADEFKERQNAAGERHWPSQIDLVADALGWKLDEVKTGPAEPIVAKRGFRTASGLEVAPGRVCGIKFLYEGMKDRETLITFSWGMAIGMAEEGLEEIRAVRIEGKPNIEVSFKLGASDLITWARIVNTIPQVMEARPGLLTVKELPVAVAVR